MEIPIIKRFYSAFLLSVILIACYPEPKRKRMYHDNNYVLFLIIILISTMSCREQNAVNLFDQYDPMIWEAMLLKKHNQHEAALELFSEAFRIIPDDNATHHFNAAESAMQLGQFEKAKKILLKAIPKTNPNRYYFNNFDGFNQFRNNQIFNEIQNKYDQLIEEYNDNLHYPKEVEVRIIELEEKDQAVRGDNIDWEKMRGVDSLNINELIKITKEYGWIERGGLLLWHQRGDYGESNYVWNHFKPLIDKEIENGKRRKDFWTRYEDEQQIRSSQIQLYGRYQNQFPIANIANIDNKRWEVGLPPLWYSANVYGWDLPVDYSTEITDMQSCINWIRSKKQEANGSG